VKDAVPRQGRPLAGSIDSQMCLTKQWHTLSEERAVAKDVVPLVPHSVGDGKPACLLRLARLHLLPLDSLPVRKTIH